MSACEYLFEPATAADLPAWLDSKRACYREYVDQYYGGWEDEMQAKLNAATFEKALRMSYFRKLTLNGATVGFCGYDEQDDCITGITIHMYEAARNHGAGSRFLLQIIELSRTTVKPAYLKVFKTNPAQNLYRRLGFRVYDETDSHLLMVYRST